MNWSEALARVVIEAAHAHPEDVVLVLGDATVADALRPLARAVHTRETLDDPPPGTSIVCMVGWLRGLPPPVQAAALRDAGRLLPTRGLLIIGDVMWSFPPGEIDAPEQFGDRLDHAPLVRALEKQVRDAGFLPDVHRLSPGTGIIVGMKT